VTRVLSPSSKQPKSKLPKEVDALAKSKTAEVTTNADGSVTRRRDTAKTSKELTTRTGKLLESSVEFNKSTRTVRGNGESKFVAKTDMLGRESTQQHNDFTNNAGVNTQSIKGTDVYGIEKQGKTTSKTVEKGATTESSVRSTSKDSVGNKHQSSDVTRVTEQGKSTVTTTEKRASGSELTTRSDTTYENKKFTVSGGADWFKETRVDKSKLTETDYDPTKVLEKTDKVTEWVGKIFKGLGLEQQWQSELSASLMKERVLASGEHGSVTARYGVTGGQELTIDGDGIRGRFNREAKAGVYAEAHGAVEGRFGSASYDASAKAEAVASIDAQGKIDANGLDATVTARVGVSVEAEITGRAQTKGVQIGGVEVYAAVEGRVRASAEAVAEATGTVKVTRNPPTAIVRGTAGASAVAKIEGDIHASAGPFTIVASGYLSAGAEARASGVIGFEDGKIKIGGSLGAALGVGAGADVAIEIDVAMIGEMAKDAADLNNDGKLGLDDAMVAVEKTAQWIGGLFGHHPKASPPHASASAFSPSGSSGGLSGISALDGPKFPGVDATPQELARYDDDAKQHERMMEILGSILKKSDELKKALSRAS
jgi:hypothetical protein